MLEVRVASQTTATPRLQRAARHLHDPRAQVLPSAKQLGIPMDKLNVNGGAIALGHPFGMTGARLVLTVLRGLEETGGRYGLATLCVGGGQGMAVVIERL